MKNTGWLHRLLHSGWLWLALAGAFAAPALSREGGEYIPLARLFYDGLINTDWGFVGFILVEYAVWVVLLSVSFWFFQLIGSAIIRYVRPPQK